MPLIATLTLNPAMDLSVSTAWSPIPRSCAVLGLAMTLAVAASTWRGW